MDFDVIGLPEYEADVMKGASRLVMVVLETDQDSRGENRLLRR
jgi:hypothetical protein